MVLRRRRGDRMEVLFAAVHESAHGRYCCKKIFRIPTRNIDSSGAPVGFESCALGGGRRLLQQNRHKADIRIVPSGAGALRRIRSYGPVTPGGSSQ